MKKIVALTFLVILACSKEAEETVEEFSLTVNSSEGGSVNNQGGTFSNGTRVTITATPNERFEFWDGPDSSYGDRNPLTVTITDDTVTATFERIRYKLGVNVSGQGNVTKEVISQAKTEEDYNSGTNSFKCHSGKWLAFL